MAESGGLSLRPMGMGGFNAFSGFAKGSSLPRQQQASAADKGSAPIIIRKPEGEVLRYTKEFLLKLAPRSTRCPVELQQFGAELMLSEDQAKPIHAQMEQGRADNWRPNAAVAQDNLPKLQRAEDMGRQAWAPSGTTVEGADRILMKLRGILNKLTPENYDKLLDQLSNLLYPRGQSPQDLQAASLVLKETIPLVFGKAVAEPTFCSLYAEMCLTLQARLPELPPIDDSGKPLTFKRCLLNQCQDEFEGIAKTREDLKKTPPAEREPLEQGLKQRTLGTVQLIAELFNKELLPGGLLCIVMEDVLSHCISPDSREPSEDNIEAVCKMITISGKRLEASPRKGKLQEYMKKLDVMRRDSKMPSRLKFCIADVMDLRSAKWVPRREESTAKKISEIRDAAKAELGMVDSGPQMSFLPQLPTLSAMPAFAGNRGGAGEVDDMDDSVLFPEAASWKEQWQQQQQQPAQPARPVLSEEEKVKKGKGLIDEYTSIVDKKEALECVKELNDPSFMGRLVGTMVEKTVLEYISDRQQQLVGQLLALLIEEGEVGEAAVREGMQKHLEDMEDLAIDAPKAPGLVGMLIGCAITAGGLPTAALAEMMQAVEGCEPRRGIVLAALQQMKKAKGEEWMAAEVGAADLGLGKLLEADPEFDPPDLPAVPAALQKAGLGNLPL